MRILTVRQPWAWAIIHGGKDVENRVRNIAGSYRGPVAIHAALAVDDDLEDPEHPMYGLVHAGCPDRRQFDHNRHSCSWCTNAEPRRWLDRGHIIGVVDLTGVHVARATASGTLVDWAEHTKPGELCSPWSEWDQHHLEFANPRPIAAPIPFTGALGLRRLPVDVTEQIQEQLDA